MLNKEVSIKGKEQVSDNTLLVVNGSWKRRTSRRESVVGSSKKTIEQMLIEEEYKKRRESLGDFSQYMNPPEEPDPFSKFMNVPVTEMSVGEINNSTFYLSDYALSYCVREIAAGAIDLNNAQFIGHCITEEHGESVVYLVFRCHDNKTWCLKLCDC